jgi:hypothetical protein
MGILAPGLRAAQASPFVDSPSLAPTATATRKPHPLPSLLDRSASSDRLMEQFRGFAAAEQERRAARDGLRRDSFSRRHSLPYPSLPDPPEQGSRFRRTDSSAWAAPRGADAASAPPGTAIHTPLGERVVVAQALGESEAALARWRAAVAREAALRAELEEMGLGEEMGVGMGLGSAHSSGVFN